MWCKKAFNFAVIFVAMSVSFSARAADEATGAVGSSSPRIGRKVTFDAGYGYSNGIARFASGGYHINPDWVVEGYIEEATTVFFGHSLSRGIRSRNFWTTRLHTNLGLIHRQTYGENKFLDLMTSSFTGKDTRYEISFWDMGPELSIGSQWHWGGVHAGVDWIGVYWPVYVSKAKISLTEDDVKTDKTRGDLKPDPSARLLRVYLGVSI
ncbi:MAG: hypothetical protein RIQ81_2316 [Pseudomonadota bacterium]